MATARRYRPERGQLFLGLLIAAVLVLAVATSTARADENVSACGTYPNHVFRSLSSYGLYANDGCTGLPNGVLGLNSLGRTPAAGQNALWQASAPRDSRSWV